MVYTKHFFIHSFDHLKQAEDYIKNTGKTTIQESEDNDHLGNLFPYLINEEKTMSKKLVSTFGIASHWI